MEVTAYVHKKKRNDKRGFRLGNFFFGATLPQSGKQPSGKDYHCEHVGCPARLTTASDSITKIRRIFLIG